MRSRYFHDYQSHNESGLKARLMVVVEFGPRREEFSAEYLGADAVSWYRRLTETEGNPMSVYAQAVQEKLKAELARKWQAARQFEAQLLQHEVVTADEAKALRPYLPEGEGDEEVVGSPTV